MTAAGGPQLLPTCKAYNAKTSESFGYSFVADSMGLPFNEFDAVGSDSCHIV